MVAREDVEAVSAAAVAELLGLLVLALHDICEGDEAQSAHVVGVKLPIVARAVVFWRASQHAGLMHGRRHL